jgi:hypothetical protein
VYLLETGKGVHHVPHKIFEFIFKAATSKVEILVFGCLVRYTLGFHRSQCEASLTFISEWTGLAVPGVRRGLDGLIEKRLIKLISIGNCTRVSSIYEQSTIVKLGIKKETINKNLNKTLSLGEHSKYIENYFFNIRSQSKKQREMKHFESFKNSYSLEDISDAVKVLIEKGVPGSWEPCHRRRPRHARLIKL